MKVLVACEFSGVVRDAFTELGHEAMSCDLLPTESPGPHYEGDVFDIIEDGWDMMIAHPPCTYLANSGVRWLHEQEGRWELMREGAEFFKRLLEAPVPMVAVENPVMHKYAVEIIGRRQDQTIQPYEYGHNESKRTCLWLRGLPELEPTLIITEDIQQTTWRLPPSADRWKKRSVTFQGIAEAMAEQWGGVCPYCWADEMTDHPDGESGMCMACGERG